MNTWPQQGIHHGVPFATYRACDITQSDTFATIAGKSVSKSLITDFIPDPFAWKQSLPKKQTAAMKGGSLFDCLLTEPKEFTNRYKVQPETYCSAPKKVVLTTQYGGEWNGRTTVCKAWKAQMEAGGFTVMTPEQHEESLAPKPWNNNSNTCEEWHNAAVNDGFSVISSDQYTTATAQIHAVMAHPEAATLINGSQKQVAFRHDTKYPFGAKGLIDLIPDGEGDTLCDIKTCEPGALESRRSLQRHIFEWGYHIQAGAYCEGYSIASGVDQTKFKFIFVTSKPPFRVAVINLPFAAISLGADQYRAGMALFAQCMERNEWPSIWDGEVDLDLPEYAYTKGEEP